VHRTTLAGTERWTRRTARASTLHRRTSLKNRLPWHRTTGSGTHCAADRNSRLHRRRSCSRTHGSFVHRSRAGLRNDHARGRRWRSNWLCRNRRRWRSARRNHGRRWLGRRWYYGRWPRTNRRSGYGRRRGKRGWYWRRNHGPRSNHWRRRWLSHGGCRRGRCWLYYRRCNCCGMTNRSRRGSRRFLHRRLRHWCMNHRRRHNPRGNRRRNRLFLLRNCLQHIPGTRDV